MKDAAIRLNFRKVPFGQDNEEVLGHRVSPNGLDPSQRHISCIKKLRKKSHVTDVMEFLGLMNYFAPFVPDFANKAKPLYDAKVVTGLYKKRRFIIPHLNVSDWTSRRK